MRYSLAEFVHRYSAQTVRQRSVERHSVHSAFVAVHPRASHDSSRDDHGFESSTELVRKTDVDILSVHRTDVRDATVRGTGIQEANTDGKCVALDSPRQYEHACVRMHHNTFFPFTFRFKL